MRHFDLSAGLFDLARPFAVRRFSRCDPLVARQGASGSATMLRTAGRALLRSGAQGTQGSLRGPVAVLSSHRWFNAGGFNFSGRSDQLDEFGIATGAEREELEWKSQGKKRFDIDPPRGPFGSKEAPAIIESHYDVRIVGCSGVLVDEHDVTWFHLEKGQTFECPVCTQVFELKVIGPGGQPGHDEHH